MTFKISPDSKSENKYILQASKQNQPRISFKGLESVASYVCSQVQTGEIVGPTAVDIVAMVAPRTIIDSTRSKDAGRETFIRETSGNIINCIAPGFVAAGAGWLLGKFIKPELKINTALPVDSDTLEMLHHSWKNAKGHEFWKEGVDKKQVIERYINQVLDKSKGLVGQEWIALKDKPEAKSLAGEIADLILRDKKASGKELKTIKEKLVQILGASESVNVINNNKKTLNTTVDRLINGIHDLGRQVLTKVEPNKVDVAIDKMTKTSKNKSVIAVGIITSLALAQQAVNRYMTKKRTGSDAFVGLSEESRKDSNAENTGKTSKTKFYLAKALSVVAITGIAAATISDAISPKKIWQTLGNGKNLVKKLEFNSLWPHLNQLRAVYAAMIVGRMIASTDKHELRETDTRDIPGFLNWLVLGGFISKLTGKKISGGKLINSLNPLEKGTSAWENVKHFLKNEKLMSHAEIDARKGLDIAEKKLLKTKLNIAIFAGLAYSTLALGLFMPILNKHITNKLTAKKKPQDKPNPEKTATVSFNSINNDVFADFIKTQQRFKKA